MSLTTAPGLNLDLNRIAEACRAFHVRHLDLFGSATTDCFDPERSDVDMLVQFDMSEGRSALDSYVSLQKALEAIVGRKVDLILDGEMRNPYFRASVERQRQRLYP